MIDRGQRFNWVDENEKSGEFEHSYALIIGINEYGAGIRSLSTAANDARRLADILSAKHGYEVSLLTQAITSSRLEQELCERLPGRIGKNDRCLFYFAGHGIATKLDDKFQEPEGFLLLQDAVQGQSHTYLPMVQLHRWLSQLCCRHLLAILDCCFAGAFRWSIATRASAPQREEIVYREKYRRYIQYPAWQVITSASHDQRALDNLGGDQLGERGESTRHSPFAQALFDGLAGKADLIPRNGGDGLITATELQLYLRDTVDSDFSTIVRRRQTPELWHLRKHNKGEFVFTLRELELPRAADTIPPGNPYRGLDSYDETDAALYFGRQRLSEQLYLKVCDQPLTVVLGASGTGKSSLVKAGLLPQLRSAVSPTWQILPVLRPGAEPLRRLNETLASVGAADHILLVVDQVEELVTLCQPKEAAQFVEQLSGLLAAPGGRIHIVLTLRIDFEPHIRNTCLQTYWEGGRFVVDPMNQEELKEAIEQPAAARVFFFDPPNLVDKIAEEVVHEPNALPLLSFTLSQLFERSQNSEKHNRTLTSADYDAIGGVIGILSRCADEIYDKLDAAHRLTMRHLLLRMVTIESGEKARRRVPRAELTYFSSTENQRVEYVLKQLVDARLLAVETAPGSDETLVEPAHEALISAWDRLSQWLREEDETILLHRSLTHAAGIWLRAKESEKKGLLWSRDPRLAQIHQALAPRDYAKGHQLQRTFFPTTKVFDPSTWLNRSELGFVQASLRQKAASARRTGIIMLFFVAAALGLWNLARIAGVERQTRQIAESRRLANIALQDIAVNPARSIQLSRSALPAEGQDRPYVPEAENALTQAIQRNQLRQTMVVQAKGAEQVAFGRDAIAIGGESLNLIARRDHGAGQHAPALDSAWLSTTAAITPSQLSGEAADIVAWAANGDLLAVNSHSAHVWRNGQPFQTHTMDAKAMISCTVWSPHSDMIAFCADTRVWIWLLATDEIVELPPFPAFVNGVSWSADGKWLAVATPEQVTVHPIGDGEPLVIFDSSAGDIQSTLFINQAELLTWEYDGIVRRWSISGKQLSVYENHRDEASINDVQLSPDQARLAVAYADGTIDLWPLEAAAPMPHALPAHSESGILDLAWHDNYLAAASADGIAYIWDRQQDLLVTRLAGHKGRIHRIIWEPDGRHIVSYGGDGTLRTWQVFDEHNSAVCDLGSSVVETWHCTTLLHAQLRVGEPIHEVMWIDNGHIAGTTAQGKFWTWGMGDKPVPHIERGAAAGTGSAERQTTLSNSGKYRFTFTPRGPGELWHNVSGVWLPVASFTQSIEDVFWSGDQLIVVRPQGQVDIVAVIGGKPTHQTIQIGAGSAVPATVSEASVYNDRLAVAYKDGRLAMFDLGTNKQLFTLPSKHPTPLSDLSWLNGGKRLLMLAGQSDVISLISTDNGQPVWPPLWRDDRFSPIPPAPNPHQAYAIFGFDNTLYGLDLQDGTELMLAQIPDTFGGLYWNQAGSRLLTWDSGNVVRIWHWSETELSLTQILEIRTRQSIHQASYSPDETHILTADDQGSVLVWQVWPTLEALLEMVPDS